MRIHLAANYLGYHRGRELETELRGRGHEVLWYGADAFDVDDDYPVYCIRTAQAVVADEDAGILARGIIVGGSGAAEVIATNKVNGARAAAGASADYVRDARQHADANIVVLGCNQSLDQSREVIDVLLLESFLNELDDARRIVNVNEFESSGTIEGWMIAYTSGSSGL
jgi:ribose 5-phosphate isomerase B